ncbi:hypothetical protein DYU11_22565 [Fibrisoma montanum]|uniref:DUF935 family protein n=1 Tax=Fibrisoma montanum TaxID=2305895 RepID=A0A418M237_9BACT|nr:hypothetical protein [Fibrisoma montanum]RIV19715.1 hypothetical protein DYU11_22565 [Fibrisoma montanum]
MRAKIPKVAKRPPATKSKVAGFLGFGKDDLFPQKLLELLDESDTAGACIDARTEFIQGNGFTDRTLADMVVNRHGQTLDQVLADVAEDVSIFETITLLISYNGLGEIAGIRHVPFEQIRLKEPDDFNNITHAGIFPYKGSELFKNRRDEHTVLPLFNPDPVVVMTQIDEAGGLAKYYGQLLYLPLNRLRGNFYPVPRWFRAEKSIQTERELINYDWKTTVNGFNISGLFAYLGSEEDVPDEETLEYQLSEHQGSENSGSIVTIKARDKDELEQMKFFDVTGAHLADRYNSTNDRVQARIARNMRVPNELANMRRQGGIMFSADELKVASQMLQQNVNQLQRKVKTCFENLLMYWRDPKPAANCTIENLNYFKDAASVQQAG